jgi:hypothetical protein
VNWTRSINGYYAIHVQQGFPQCFALNLPANAHSDIDATKASDLMRQQQQCSYCTTVIRWVQCLME